MRCTRLVLSAAVLIPSLTNAQLMPLTGDLQANTYATTHQREAVVAANPNTGSFVVAWQSYSQDGSDYGVFAQRFASDGSLAGSEFQVNSYTDYPQGHPALGVDPGSGAFVVAWESPQDGSSYGVFAQRFSSDGSPAGSEFQVNSYTGAHQLNPALGVDPGSGAFVIAWDSFFQDGSSYGVFAQRFASDGSPAGSEFQVNSFTNDSQRNPALGVDPGSGAFVVAWNSFSQDGYGGSGVFAQRFASDGSATGGEFQVNSHTNDSQSNPAVGVDPNSGAFVVGWTSYSQDGSSYGVFAQRFASNGTTIGGEFQVNSVTNDSQNNPAVGVDPSSGAFVVGWTSYSQDGSNDGVFAQRFASDGSATGGEFQVNDFTFLDQDGASVSARGAGEFAIAWSDGSGKDGCIPGFSGVFAQRFASDGSPAGSEFQLNTFTYSNQTNPAVGVDPVSGAFVVAWHSDSQDNDGYGVFAQRFASDGSPAGSEFQVNSFADSQQRYPAVGVDPGSGAFVVAWHSYLQDGSSYGVFAQRFDSDGSPAGSEFQVNSVTYSIQIHPAVAVNPGSGAFVVAWQSYPQDGSGYGVFAQRFASDGSPAGSEFQVNSYTYYPQRNPAVGVDPVSGAFVIAWNSNTQDGYGSEGVFAQRFASDGSPAGSEFQVNSYTTSNQGRPAVGVDPTSDTFVVAWYSYSQDGSSYGVFAQRFASDGSPTGSEFQINCYTTSQQSDPAVAVNPATGAFVVAWQSNSQDGGSYGVFAQRFASDGSSAGSEFQSNSYTTFDQRNPALGVDPISGSFVVAWNTNGQDGCNPSTSAGAFVRLFGDPAGTPTVTATATQTTTATATATPTSGSSAVCPASPAMGCAVPTKGKLIVKDNTDDTKDKLVWKFGKGPLLVQTDFGDPVTTNGYAFCVYDDATLKIDLTIPAGTPWEQLSTKGFQYKDSNGANDGVTKAKLIGGEAGKSKLQLKGKGPGLAVPMPASGSQLFAAGTSVVVQLHGNGDCWETAFTPAQSTHKVNSYKGKF